MLMFNDELKNYLMKFKETFGDIVPLRQISPTVTNEQLIDAIKQSVEQKNNLLPQIFGYCNSKDKVY